MTTQLSLLSELDTSSDVETEEISLGDFRILLSYLNREVDYCDAGFKGTTDRYSYRGGYVWRLFSPAGLLVDYTIPETDRKVAIEVAKLNAKIYAKQLGLSTGGTK